MLLPGRFALFESGVIQEALLGQHIIQPDVPCPAQVGACAICTDQLWMLCYRGIVWRGGGHRYSPANNYSGCRQLESPAGDDLQELSAWKGAPSAGEV